MCTVSFIPTENGVVITSNRDEHLNRKLAGVPVENWLNGSKVIYPIDQEKGGTWIAVKDNGDAAVLLNGAFVKHRHGGTYRQSRGLIFLEIFKANDLYEGWLAIDLEHIEPFTIILFSKKELFECRWDGESKFMKKLDEAATHFWSSATLYDATSSAQRKGWFVDWIEKTPYPKLSEIIAFHQSANDGDLGNALVMRRPDGMMTMSISTIRIAQDKCEMKYFDLRNDTSVNASLQIHQTKAISLIAS